MKGEPHMPDEPERAVNRGEASSDPQDKSSSSVATEPAERPAEAASAAPRRRRRRGSRGRGRGRAGASKTAAADAREGGSAAEASPDQSPVVSEPPEGGAAATERVQGP